MSIDWSECSNVTITLMNFLNSLIQLSMSFADVTIRMSSHLMCREDVLFFFRQRQKKKNELLRHTASESWLYFKERWCELSSFSWLIIIFCCVMLIRHWTIIIIIVISVLLSSCSFVMKSLLFFLIFFISIQYIAKSWCDFSSMCSLKRMWVTFWAFNSLSLHLKKLMKSVQLMKTICVSTSSFQNSLNLRRWNVSNSTLRSLMNVDVKLQWMSLKFMYMSLIFSSMCLFCSSVFWEDCDSSNVLMNHFTENFDIVKIVFNNADSFSTVRKLWNLCCCFNLIDD